MYFMNLMLCYGKFKIISEISDQLHADDNVFSRSYHYVRLIGQNNYR